MDYRFFAPTWRHRLALKIIGIFPQIQMVALCNSRATGEVDINSDIDLFIITRGGNLWTGRFAVTAITSILGIRRCNTHGLQKGSEEYIRRTKDKYCLSFFITEEHLDLGDIRLQPEDPYLDQWIQTLVPIIDKNKILEKFFEINNVFPSPLRRQGSIRENGDGFHPAYRTGRLAPPKVDWLEGRLGSIIYYLLFIISIFEDLIKHIWLPKTLRSYVALGRPWGVVISDTMLKFHDQDIRKEFQK